MFLRRARAGQCFYQPFLGCREFSVREWELIENRTPDNPIWDQIEKKMLKVDDDFGIMFRDFDYDPIWNHWPEGARPASWKDKQGETLHPTIKNFLHAKAKSGWIDVATIQNGTLIEV